MTPGQKNFFILLVFQFLCFSPVFSDYAAAKNNNVVEIKKIYGLAELVEPQHKGKYIYPPAFAFDGDKSTVWAFHGQKINFYNSYLSVRFSGNIQIDEIQVINGFAKDLRLYKNNNRIKKMVINGGRKSFTGILKDNDLNWQSIKFNVPLDSDHISFEIAEVYQGKYNDTCLADIRLLNNGVPMVFSNIQSLVNSQKEASLQKVRSANQSFENYFKILYLANRFNCYEGATNIEYAFEDDRVSLRKVDASPPEIVQFSMSGHYLNLSGKNSYFEHPLKLHINTKDLDTIIINGNRCERLEQRK